MGGIVAPVPTGRVATETVAHLALRVGRQLVVDGADTTFVQDAVLRMVEAFGAEGRVLVSAESVLLVVQDQHTFRTKLGRAIAGSTVDMGRLAGVVAVVEQVEAGERDPARIDAALAALERRAGHPWWLVTLGMAVTAGSLARLFGAAWPVVAAACLAGACSTPIRIVLGRRGFNPIATAVLAVFASAWIAATVLRGVPGVSPTLCLAAAGMILVPGVPLINGVRELVGGHAVNGVARLALAIATVLAIGFALHLAALAAGVELPVEGNPGLLPVGEDLLFSALAAAGFAMLFSVPLHAVWACMLCGLASHGLRTALEHQGLDLAIGSLCGALAAGFVARVCAARYRIPATAFVFPGVVAMIPGSYGFRAGLGGLELARIGPLASPDLVASTLSLSVVTSVVTIAIAVGLTFALSIRSTRDRDAAHPSPINGGKP